MSDEAVPNPASEEGDPPAEEGAGSTQGANGGNDEEMSEDEAATKIQAAMRGKTARRKAAEEDRMSAAKQVAEMMGDTGAYVREEGRGCTDCLFCLIFAAYWGLMVYLILFAVEHGNLDRLIKPRDMDMHSCGLQTGPVDLRQYNQLYLPNPANKKIQICVNGCPGGATGHCSGNLTRNYLVVDGQPVNAGAAGVALGTLGSLVGMKLPGPDGYDRHDTCVEKGDCSNGDADVAEAYCTNQGRCLNSTRPQNANWADDVVSDSVPKRQCLYSHTLETTGHTFEPFTWTPYVWTHNQDQSLFVCMPKEMPGAPTDAAYPPVDFMTANLKGWISASGPCFMPAFASKDILFRCVPLMLKDMMSKDKLSQSAKGQEVVQFMSDIQKYWKVIPLGAGVAVIIAFAWIIFLSKFANYVIWGSVYGIEILLPIVSLFCWWKLGVVDTRSCKAAALDAAGDPLDPTLGSLCHSAHISMSPEIYSYTGDALANCEAVACAASTAAGVPCPYPAGSCVYTPGMYVEIPPAMLHEMEKAHSSKAHTYNLAVGSLIAWVVLGIIFIVFSTRIHIAIGVIEEASDAFLDIPTAVFFPVVLLLISLPVSLFCCFAYFMLLSLRSVDPTTGAITYCLDPSVAEIVNPGVGDPNCHILKGMLFVEVFGWLWTVQWFSSIQYTSVAGAVARWYFTPTVDSNGDGHLTKDVSHTLLFDAIRRTMRHHLGTMAFGAFITAVVITIKYVLTYMISQIQAQSPENKIIKIGGEILKIAIACLERFIRFVGHIAYIQTAIYGTSFCRSVVKAFVRLLKNVVRFSFVTLFSKLVLIIGILMTVGGAVWVALFCIHLIYPGPDPNALPGAVPTGPAFLVAFFSYTIANNIMGIYETAIDTILVSFLEDEAENDDKGKMTFAGGDLARFMKGTVAIAQADEAFKNASMDAKSSKIRSNNESEQVLLEGSKEAAANKKGHRDKTKEKKKAAKGKGNGSREKDLADSGGVGDEV